MDSDSMAMPVLPGEVQCILCADVINFNNSNEDMFFSHMKNYHKVSINNIFVFGIHFMDDHSVGQIVDNFKQDYYDLININKDKGVSNNNRFEHEKLLDEHDFDSLDYKMELANPSRSSDQSISNYVNKILECPPEKCDECENEFNIHYRKCIFHGNIPSKRKLVSATNESTIKGDKCSPYYDPKSKKISGDNSNGANIKNSSSTKNSMTANFEQSTIESSDYFKEYPNQLLRNFSDRSTFDIIDGSLPEGWRVKKRTRTKTKTCKSTDYYIYLSPDDKILRSLVAVVEYMKMLDIYSQDQLEIAKTNIFRKKIEEEKLLGVSDQIEDFSIVSSISSEDTSPGAGSDAIVSNNYEEYGDDSMSEYNEDQRMIDLSAGVGNEDGGKKLDEAVKQKLTLGVGLHGERHWQCTDCDYSYKSRTNVVNHIESKHFDEKIICKLCNAPFSSRNSFKRHMKNVHKDCEKYEDHDGVDDQMDTFNINELLDGTDQTDDFDTVSSSADTLSGAGTVANDSYDYGQNGDDSMSEYNENHRINVPFSGSSHEDGNQRWDEAVKPKMTLGVGLHGERQWQCTDCDYSTKKKTNIINHIESKHLDGKVFCKLCNVSFHARNYLRHHLKDKHKDSSGIEYNSDQCSYKTPEKFKLKSQKRVKHDGILFPCDLCNHKASSKGNLRQHSNAQHHDKTVGCSLCDLKFKYNSRLKQHIRVDHEKLTYDCSDCDYKVITKAALVQHKELKHEGKTYPCDQCSFIAPRKDTLTNHIRFKHKKIYQQCEKCELKFLKKYQLKRHVLKHANTETKYKLTQDDDNENTLITKYECKPCKIEFDDAPSYHIHMKTSHDKNKIKCPHCEYQVLSSKVLEDHLMVNHEGMRYKCNECDLEFKRKVTRKNHKEAVHQNIRHACDQCSYTAKLSAQIRKHTQFVHEGKMFQCSKCDYKTSLNHNLKTHTIAYHMDGVFYNCDKCSYKTKWEISLKSHKQAHDTGNLVSCQQCDWKEKSKTKLVEHVQVTHEGLNLELTCKQCNYKTSRRLYLKAHLIEQHNAFDCNLCDFKGTSTLRLNFHRETVHSIGET